MISSQVTIPVDGSPMSAYLARPEERSGAHPAVIVLQEVFGLTPETMRVTDLVASLGYVGLAIDYYHRTDPHLLQPYDETGLRNAFAAASKLSKAALRNDVAASAAWLSSQDYVKSGKVAAWGFGFGGTVALIAAELHELSGAIAFYPSYVGAALPSGEGAPVRDVGSIAVPMLICFGAEDYYVSRHEIDSLSGVLRDAGVDVHLQVYPNVGHSYFRHGRPEAVAETREFSDEALAQAVADSWDLVRSFLKRCFSRATGVQTVRSA